MSFRPGRRRVKTCRCCGTEFPSQYRYNNRCPGCVDCQTSGEFIQRGTACPLKLVVAMTAAIAKGTP